MRDEELIDKWLNNTPAEDSVEKVERILIKYFGADSVNKRSGGSHQYRVKHPSLQGLPGFGIAGHLSVPVKNGTKVKGFYLKRIAQAVKRFEEAGLA
jgi:anaerobic ribonucleoside-triphosphate reductase